MATRLPLELRTAVENLDFWSATELTPDSNRSTLLATFEEMAERARDLAGPEHGQWLENRLLVFRQRIDRRRMSRPLIQGPVRVPRDLH